MMTTRSNFNHVSTKPWTTPRGPGAARHGDLHRAQRDAAGAAGQQRGLIFVDGLINLLIMDYYSMLIVIIIIIEQNQ